MWFHYWSWGYRSNDIENGRTGALSMVTDYALWNVDLDRIILIMVPTARHRVQFLRDVRGKKRLLTGYSKKACGAGNSIDRRLRDEEEIVKDHPRPATVSREIVGKSRVCMQPHCSCCSPRHPPRQEISTPTFCLSWSTINPRRFWAPMETGCENPQHRSDGYRRRAFHQRIAVHGMCSPTRARRS